MKLKDFLFTYHLIPFEKTDLLEGLEKESSTDREGYIFTLLSPAALLEKRVEYFYTFDAAPTSVYKTAYDAIRANPFVQRYRIVYDIAVDDPPVIVSKHPRVIVALKKIYGDVPVYEKVKVEDIKGKHVVGELPLRLMLEAEAYTEVGKGDLPTDKWSLNAKTFKLVKEVDEKQYIIATRNNIVHVYRYVDALVDQLKLQSYVTKVISGPFSVEEVARNLKKQGHYVRVEPYDLNYLLQKHGLERVTDENDLEYIESWSEHKGGLFNEVFYYKRLRTKEGAIITKREIQREYKKDYDYGYETTYYIDLPRGIFMFRD